MPAEQAHFMTLSKMLGDRKFSFMNNMSSSSCGLMFSWHDDDIPVPPQFQTPSSCKLNMSPYELELMLFINEHFLSPSIFDKVMKWACSAGMMMVS